MSGPAHRRELMITPLGYVWYAFSAAWPTTMYIAGMRCLCDDHPKLLITSLSAGRLRTNLRVKQFSERLGVNHHGGLSTERRCV